MNRAQMDDKLKEKLVALSCSGGYFAGLIWIYLLLWTVLINANLFRLITFIYDETFPS